MTNASLKSSDTVAQRDVTRSDSYIRWIRFASIAVAVAMVAMGTRARAHFSIRT